LYFNTVIVGKYGVYSRCNRLFYPCGDLISGDRIVAWIRWTVTPEMRHVMGMLLYFDVAGSTSRI